MDKDDPLSLISAEQELAKPTANDLSEKERYQYLLGAKEIEEKATAKSLGLLGRLFGSKEHAPSSIAGLAIVFCFSALMVVFFIGLDKPESEASNLMLENLFTALMTALGYIFGANSKN